MLFTAGLSAVNNNSFEDCFVTSIIRFKLKQIDGLTTFIVLQKKTFHSGVPKIKCNKSIFAMDSYPFGCQIDATRWWIELNFESFISD